MASRNNTPTEAQEQIALFRWSANVRKKYPELGLMFHVANEGKRSQIVGHNLQLMGMKRGVPDICLPVPRGKWHGLFIEMKRVKGGRPTPDQLWWRDELRKQGYRSEICYGWEEAARTLREYLDTQDDV